jgi:endonuclease/exonuclease/phosphatase family metal-dependent hydrolase
VQNRPTPESRPKEFKALRLAVSPTGTLPWGREASASSCGAAERGDGVQQGQGAVDCVTWNIHRARGRDGAVDAMRIHRVLMEEVLAHQPDVLALQEADEERPPHSGLLDIARIESETGLRHAHDDGLKWGPQSHGFLGTILFLKPEIEIFRRQAVDLPGHCHRGAVIVDAARAGVPFRVVTTHLSLSQVLRAAQMRVIGQVLFRLPPMQTILLGDLNEWRPWGGLAFSTALVGRRFIGPARATFPAAWPFLPLDRILSDAAGAVGQVGVIDGPGIRQASDHRPLRARVRLVESEVGPSGVTAERRTPF